MAAHNRALNVIECVVAAVALVSEADGKAGAASAMSALASSVAALHSSVRPSSTQSLACLAGSPHASSQSSLPGFALVSLMPSSFAAAMISCSSFPAG